MKKRDPDSTLKIITPSVSFDWRNYLFTFYLSGTYNKRISSEGPDYTNRTWDANLSSNWSDKWPSVRLYYGRGRSYNDESPRTVDTKSEHKGVDASYSYSIFDVYYNYRDSKNENLVADSTSWNYNHFASIKASKGFFNNRLSLSASQQFSYSKTETETKVHGGEAIIPVQVAMGYSGVDSTPDTGALTANPALVDGDRFTSAGVEIGNTDDVNLGLETVYREVNLIYVYTLSDVSSAWVSQFKWDFYKSNDGTNWTKVSSSLSFTYNHTMKRFEIQTPSVSANYVKLYVAQNPGAGTVYVTEMEAYYQEQTGKSKITTTSTYKSYRSSFNLSWRPWTPLLCSYSLNFNRSMPEPGPDSTDLAHSASVAWTPSKYFSPTLQVSETRRKTEGEPENRSISYSLTATSSPLETLDLSAGANRSVSYKGGRKDSATNTYNFYATAVIFPDLTTSLDLVRSNTKDYQGGGDTNTFSGRFTTTARLSPKLTIDSTAEYSRNSGEEVTTDKKLSLTATWRVSDILLLRSTQDWHWVEEGMGYSSSYAFWLALTSKIQLNAQYSYSHSAGGEASHGYTSFVSWAINRHFSLKSSYSYQKTDNNKSWAFGVQLTARF